MSKRTDRRNNNNINKNINQPMKEIPMPTQIVTMTPEQVQQMIDNAVAQVRAQYAAQPTQAENPQAQQNLEQRIEGSFLRRTFKVTGRVTEKVIDKTGYYAGKTEVLMAPMTANGAAAVMETSVMLADKTTKGVSHLAKGLRSFAKNHDPRTAPVAAAQAQLSGPNDYIAAGYKVTFGADGSYTVAK